MGRSHDARWARRRFRLDRARGVRRWGTTLIGGARRSAAEARGRGAAAAVASRARLAQEENGEGGKGKASGPAMQAVAVSKGETKLGWRAGMEEEKASGPELRKEGGRKSLFLFPIQNFQIHFQMIFDSF